MAQIDRITLDPSVMGGKPCVRGLRVTVATVLGLLAAGRSRDEILKAYPYLEVEDIEQCLAYAAWRMEERDCATDDRMSIQILIDMNLSPDWVDKLSNHGWASTHWSTFGDPKATDHELMDWARNNSHVVFTHDLDFGTMLALSFASNRDRKLVDGERIQLNHDFPITGYRAVNHHRPLSRNRPADMPPYCRARVSIGSDPYFNKC